MRFIFSLLLAFAALLALPAFAADSVTQGQLKLDLIKKLESDGFLSSKLANEAKEKYVDPRELTMPVATAAPASQPSLWDRYASWSNFFKVAGVLLLLVAFGGYIAKAAMWMAFVIVAIPKEVYQATFSAATLLATLRPDLIWASQAFYLALFGAFANIVLAVWIVATHPRLEAAMARLFRIGLPPASVASFWGMLYFIALALAYQSQLFGFFAAVCLSGIFTFVVGYRPGVLFLDFDDKFTGPVVFGHLVVLAGYAALKITGHLPHEIGLFSVGLEYYCTIAMSVGFLVAASPFWHESTSKVAYLLLFVLVLLAGIAGYFFYDLKVIGSILCCVAILLALEWYGKFSYSFGFLFGTALMGGVLYGGALAMERHAHPTALRVAYPPAPSHSPGKLPGLFLRRLMR